MASPEDMYWSKELGLPTEDIYKDSVFTGPYREYSYMLSHAKNLIYMGKKGKAFQLLAEMEPEKREDIAHRSYMLSRLYEDMGKLRRSMREARRAKCRCPDEPPYIARYNKVSSRIKRDKRNSELKKFFVYLAITVLIGAAGIAACAAHHNSLENIVSNSSK
jgi:hypothetical protein